MKKTEYRIYISSEYWQKRRRDFLRAYDFCEQCAIPRWLAIIAYDQDLHVHHRNYSRIGQELDEDLSPLCRRCHEIETFGTSHLHQPKTAPCRVCHIELCWDFTDHSYRGCCESCKTILDMSIGNFDSWRLAIPDLGPEGDPLEAIKRQLLRAEKHIMKAGE